jgi:hypothetical protein
VRADTRRKRDRLPVATGQLSPPSSASAP